MSLQRAARRAAGWAALLAAGDKIGSTQSAVVLENLISQFLFNKAAEGSSGNEGGPKK